VRGDVALEALFDSADLVATFVSEMPRIAAISAYELSSR